MKYVYIPKGVCSRKITVEINDNIIDNVEFEGGCNGNTQGVARLCRGRDADEVIGIIEGIRCGFKNTSCPDQLAKAIRLCKEQTEG